MATILAFTPKPPATFGFERVKKKKDAGARNEGQLHLFAGTDSAPVLRLPSKTSAFDEAYLLDERNDQRAEEAYLRAIEHGDGTADAYCNLGIIKHKSGLKTKAFDCFTKSLEQNPRHAESHYNLGNLYLEEGDVRLSRMHYELAAEIEPDFPNVYFNLGLVAALSADFPLAVNSLKKYKALASKDEGQKADSLLETLQRSMHS